MIEAARKQELNELLSESPYEVIDRLGRGAMAEVFTVRHRLLRKRFALKLIHHHLAEEPNYVARLQREARALGRIESPYIVRIVDLSLTTAGTPYLVLELMKGHSLARELFDRGKVPFPEMLTWLIQALRGLRAAHDISLVHRDITPENLFVTDVADYGRTLKIMDFGLTRVMPDSLDSRIQGHGTETTSTGIMVGSPAYASPEAMRGERLDHRADIFALGLVTFEALTGLGPFDLDGYDLPPLSKHASGLPPAFEQILRKAVDVNREKRFENTTEFLDAVLHLQKEMTP